MVSRTECLSSRLTFSHRIHSAILEASSNASVEEEISFGQKKSSCRARELDRNKEMFSMEILQISLLNAVSMVGHERS